MTFGEYLKMLRNRNGLGVREYAREIDMDSSNYVTFETSIRSAPKSRDKVLHLVRKLVLSRHEKDHLCNLAKEFHIKKVEAMFDEKPSEA